MTTRQTKADKMMCRGMNMMCKAMAMDMMMCGDMMCMNARSEPDFPYLFLKKQMSCFGNIKEHPHGCFFYAIGNCVLLHKSTTCIDAQLAERSVVVNDTATARARNKSCANGDGGRESVRSALLFSQETICCIKAKEALISMIKRKLTNISC